MKNYHKIITEPGRGRRGGKPGAKRRRRSRRTEHNPSGRGRVSCDEPVDADLETDHAALTGGRRCYSRRGVRPGRLVKFLRSRVGDRCSDAWSDVCAMPGGAFDQHHIREHVLDEIDVGKDQNERWRRLYPFTVDDAGLLRETPYRNAWPQRRHESMRLSPCRCSPWPATSPTSCT
jgi:hypothetical protein